MIKESTQTQLQFINANGIEFAYLEVGEGPFVLCLHGFPDTAYTFKRLMNDLAASGYRVIAPFMRGYAPTSIPEDGDYSALTLGQDVVALIDALTNKSGEKAILIGHDWGAIASYVACNMAPEKVSHSVTCAVPHPRVFIPNLPQLKRSWYMLFFQLRNIAEKSLRKADFKMIDKLYNDWSPNWLYHAEDIEPIKSIMRMPENLKATLGYYRAILKPPSKETRQTIFHKTSTRNLTIAGGNDGCITKDMFNRQHTAFEGGCELVIFEDGGHFMHKEQPERFFNTVLNFIKS